MMAVRHAWSLLVLSYQTMVVPVFLNPMARKIIGFALMAILSALLGF